MKRKIKIWKCRDIGAQNYTHCDSLGEKKLAFQNASNIPVGIVRI